MNKKLKIDSKILIFSEVLIYKYINSGKRVLGKLFREIYHDNLIIVFLTTNEQYFNSRLSVANLEYKTAFVVTYASKKEKLTATKLKRVLKIKKGAFTSATLVSNLESDALIAEKLGLPFVFIGESKNSYHGTVLKNLSLLPNILGLNTNKMEVKKNE